MASQVREGLLLVIQGMFMKTFISAAQEKENSVSRMVQPGSVHGKEACLSGQWDSRGLAGPTQLARGDIIGQGTESWLGNTGTVSSAPSLHLTFRVIYFSFRYLMFSLERNSLRHLQNIHPQATSKFAFGEPLRESDLDL